jgi:bifunctional non-homologous end joining protein LigD
MLPEERKRLPRDQEAYGFEFEWGGRRALAYVSGGQVTLTDGTDDLPLPTGLSSGLGAALGARPALLDGELAEVEGHEIYMIFDLLHLEGRSLLAEPYEERRRRLDELKLAGPRWQTAPWYPGEGAPVREAARRQGLPGILAKRRDSPYEPGKRSAAWLLIPVSG